VKREYAVLYQSSYEWIMATVPALPGVVTQEKSLSEARTMIKAAVELNRIHSSTQQFRF
jgi:predicted RNase H-like HicB family nuclease